MKPGPAFTAWYRTRNSSALIGELARRLGIETVEAAGVFLERSYEEPLFRDEVHFNVAGHELMTRLIIEAVCERDLMPRRCAPIVKTTAAE